MQLSSIPVVLLLAAPVCAQQVRRVPQDYPSIQAGIQAAQSGDTVLVAPGTYLEQIDFLSKAITVSSAAGPAVTTVDSRGDFRILSGGEASYAAVTMTSVGPDSVLRGFTVTGVDYEFGNFATGIFTSGQPLIENCRIVDNKSSLAGGVFGSPTLIDCEISGNSASLGGGGISGAPTVIRCLIADNRSQDVGGGMRATGPCEIVDSVFLRNQTGIDGYSGGAVFGGPANLTGCVIAYNIATPYYSGVPMTPTTGGGLASVGRVEGCTVFGNEIPLVLGVQATGGGISDATEIVDTIVWGNLPDQMPFGESVRYSDVEGGYPGVGNINAAPQFVDALLDDFALQPGSSCIDAGDPASALDADGTRADMGALPNLGPLTSQNGFELSIATGGEQNLELDFLQVQPALEAYLVLGSASGTVPGTPLGALLVPLNLDSYTLSTFRLANSATYQQSFAIYATPDPVTPTLSLPAGVASPSLVGITLNHAALRIGLVSLTAFASSNPVPLTLVP